jgi:pyruvate/2-oxoglutarate dehydrogenase complex dihydrolipoamide acyltransferase (E2) component
MRPNFIDNEHFYSPADGVILNQKIVEADEPVVEKPAAKVSKTAAEKAAEKAAKDAEKAAEKAAKDAEKAAEKAAKEAQKAAEKAEKEAQKAAEKAAKDAAKATKKVEKVAVEKPKAEDEDQAEVVKKIEFAGNKYLKSKKTGIVYDYAEYVKTGDQIVVGQWNNDTNAIDFKKACDDEEESEDEYDE